MVHHSHQFPGGWGDSTTDVLRPIIFFCFLQVSRVNEQPRSGHPAELKDQRFASLSRMVRYVLPLRPRPGSILPYIIVRGIETCVIRANQITSLSLRDRCEISVPIPYSVTDPPDEVREITYHASGKMKDVPSW